MSGAGVILPDCHFPFVCDKINGAKMTIIPTEPTACPTLTRGPFQYDFGDTACQAPLMSMFTLGHSFVPPPIHPGGLRYHGMAPLVSHAVKEGLLEPRASDQIKCYKSALTWAKTEGTICAPETSHAIAAVIDEAIKAKEEGKEKVILFCYSGHGLMNLMGYERFIDGKLTEYHLPEEELKKSLEEIKNLPK